MIVTVAVVVLVAVLLALAVAPRLKWFDRKEARLAFLVGGTVLVVVLFVSAAWWVQRSARQRERDASAELLAALERVTPSPARPLVAGDLPGVARVAQDGAGWIAFRPVEVAWVHWCVVGRLDASGRAAVQRVHASCP